MTTAVPARAELVGRATELGVLAAALDAAAAGAPALLLVRGESGVGKTTLLAAFGALAAERGARVLVGGCVPATRELPLAPVLEAFRAEPDVPDPAGDAGPASRSQLFDRFRRHLGRLAARQPVVLAVEDLHWADPSTLDLLAYLARTLRDEPLLILLTCRDDLLDPADPVRRWLAELPRLRPGPRLDLRRLTRAETAVQIAGLLGDHPGTDLVDAVFARSEGNPLVTESLVEAAGTDVAAIPASLREMVLGRLAGLPAGPRALLRLAAAAGRQVRHPVLAALAGQDEDEVLAAVRTAVEAHVLVPDRAGEAYRFRHALVRDVVYEDTLPAERRHLHGRIARALTERPELRAADHDAELAGHWYAAGEPERALPVTVRAGLAALAGFAHGEALQLLQRGLDLWDAGGLGAAGTRDEVAGVDRATVEAAASRAAQLCGEADRALALARAACDRVLASGPPDRAAALLIRVGQLHCVAGRRTEAGEAYRRALDLLADHPPSPAHARALAGLARIHVAWSELAEGGRMATAAIDVAVRVGAVAEEGQARHALALVLGHRGDLAAGVAELRTAREIAERLDDPTDVGLTSINLAYLLGVAGRHAEAVTVALHGHAASRRLGTERQDGSFLLGNAAESLVALGRWDEAAELLERAEGSGTRGAREFGSLLVAARLRTGRGDFAGARARLARAAGLLDGGAFTTWRRGVLELEAECAAWEGRLGAARAAVAAGLDLYAESGEAHFAGPLLALGLRVEADAADRARSARNDAAVGAALAAVAELLRRAGGLGTDLLDPEQAVLPDGRAAALTCRAEVSRAHARPDDAGWAAAAAAWDGLERPFPAGYARLRAAEALLRRDGATAAATAELRAAAGTARSLGAEPLAERCRQLARWHRIDLAPGSVHTPPATLSAGTRTAGPASPFAGLGAAAQARTWPAGPRPAPTRHRPPGPTRPGPSGSGPAGPVRPGPSGSGPAGPTRPAGPTGPPGSELTAREREILAHVAAGHSNGEIGRLLVISPKTASVHVSNILRKLGVSRRTEAARVAHHLGLELTTSAAGRSAGTGRTRRW